jgi:shikimate kinase
LKKRSGKTIGASRTRVRNPPLRESAAQSSGTAVFLVGFMGAGKSSVGRALGQQLNWFFEDLDDRIERRERRTVAQIFRDSGELAFRRAEHSALQNVLDGLGDGPRIIALGGGAFVQNKNSALLQSSGVPTVFLDAPVDELWQRCCRQAREAGTERPLLRSVEEFRELYEMRRRGYAHASIRIETGSRTVDEIAAEIVATLGLKKIELRLEQGEVE